MGCTFAHPRNGDVNPRIFKVLNVDSEGHERNPGKIEITELELILHQKGKTPIRWPLRSLRRYGFDAELFSFESGRRCPTGAGIYAFQCQRAEALFNLLQGCIQRAGEDEQAMGQGASPQTALHFDRPMTNNTLENNNVLRTNTTPPTMIINRSRSQGADGVVSLQTFPSMSSPNAHEYINTDIIQNGPVIDIGETVSPNNINIQLNNTRNSIDNSAEAGIQYAQLDLHRNSLDTQLSPQDPTDSSQNMYINIQSTEVNGSKPRSASLTSPAQQINNPPLLHVSSVTEDHHEYLNLGLNMPKKPTNSAGTGGGPPLIHPKLPAVDPPDQSRSEPKVTYIEVDFKNNEETPVASGGSRVANGISNGDSCNNGNLVQIGPNRNGSVGSELLPPNSQRTESYAVIDFDKTAAINAKNAKDDEGSRKTRHNSSIEELQ